MLNIPSIDVVLTNCNYLKFGMLDLCIEIL